MSGQAGAGGVPHDDDKAREELQKIMSNPSKKEYPAQGGCPYVLQKKLGNGEYGVVYRALNTEDGTTVAIKCSPNLYGEKCMSMEMRREFAAFERLNSPGHPNVLQSEDQFMRLDHGYSFIVTPFFRKGDLYGYFPELLDMPKEARDARIARWTGQLVSALHYMHTDRGVCHRDIKPANILVDTDEDKVVICDFGLARRVPFERKKLVHFSPDGVFTVPYRPTEFLLDEDKHCPFEVDVWSMAVVVLEMLSCKTFFRSRVVENPPVIGGMPTPRKERVNAYSDVCTMMSIFKLLGTPTEEYWPGVSQLKNWSPLFPKFPLCNIEDHPRWTTRKVPAPVMAVLARGLVQNPAKRGTAADLVAAFDAACAE